MSATSGTDPLATIVAFESAAFRIGQLARRLHAEHPTLPVQVLKPRAFAILGGRLVISAGSVDGARAWADALDVSLDVERTDPSTIYAQVITVIDGVEVEIYGIDLVPAAEQAAAAPEPAEGGDPA